MALALMHNTLGRVAHDALRCFRERKYRLGAEPERALARRHAVVWTCHPQLSQ